MSSENKPADPYTAVNKDEADLQTKVTDLVNFITKCKFGMMTTIEAGSSQNNLVSRCMALAATVREDESYALSSYHLTYMNRNPEASTFSSTQTTSPARPTTCPTTRTSTSPSSTAPASGRPSLVKLASSRIASWSRRRTAAASRRGSATSATAFTTARRTTPDLA